MNLKTMSSVSSTAGGNGAGRAVLYDYEDMSAARSSRETANAAVKVSLAAYGIAVLGLNDVAATTTAEEVVEEIKVTNQSPSTLELMQMYRAASKGVLPL